MAKRLKITHYGIRLTYSILKKYQNKYKFSKHLQPFIETKIQKKRVILILLEHMLHLLYSQLFNK